MAKPKDINELRAQLLDAYELVKADPQKANQSKAIVNVVGVVGAVLGTLKLQLQYAALRNEKPYIPFLGLTGGEALLEEIHQEIDAEKEEA